jgi:glycine betaine/proline transport system substrate-binding protein
MIRNSLFSLPHQKFFMLRHRLTIIIFFLFSNANLQAKTLCEEPRLAEVGWTDIAATTAITKILLEGLGYKPKSHLLSIPITFASLKNQDIDIFLGLWWPTMKQDTQKYLDHGDFENPWMNLKGAKYTLAVPDYIYQAGVHHIEDLYRFKEKFQGKIYGIEAGNDGNRLIQHMITQNYSQLKDWKLIESSEQGMLSQVLRSLPQKKWIVFLGWAPHPMNKKVSLHYLNGGEQFFGPEQGGSTVYTTIRRHYQKDCPQVISLLKNLQFTLPMENEIMEQILDHRLSPEQAALKWIQHNPNMLKKWLKHVPSITGKDGLLSVQNYLKTKSIIP